MSNYQPHLCVTDAEGRRFHITPDGHSRINGTSRSVHKGGVLTCPDGLLADSPTAFPPIRFGEPTAPRVTGDDLVLLTWDQLQRLIGQGR